MGTKRFKKKQKKTAEPIVHVCFSSGSSCDRCVHGRITVATKPLHVLIAGQ
jgi:hypothetical protein